MLNPFKYRRQIEAQTEEFRQACEEVLESMHAAVESMERNLRWTTWHAEKMKRFDAAMDDYEADPTEENKEKMREILRETYLGE